MQSIQNTTKNWELLFAESDYTVITEILKLTKEKKFDELEYALESYLNYIKKREEREILWKLRDLMMLILLWKFSDQYRDKENSVKISQYRSEIEDILQFEACITRETLKIKWSEIFEIAKDRAGNYNPAILNTDILSWDEVFNQLYEESR